MRLYSTLRFALRARQLAAVLISIYLAIAPNGARAQLASATALPLITGSLGLDRSSLPAGLAAQAGVQRIEDTIVEITIANEVERINPDSSGSFTFVLPRSMVGATFSIRAWLGDELLFVAGPLSGTLTSTGTHLSLVLRSRIPAQARSRADEALLGNFRRMLDVKRPHAFRLFDVVTDRAIVNGVYGGTPDSETLRYARFTGDVLIGEQVPCPSPGWTCTREPRTQSDALGTPLNPPVGDLKNRAGLAALAQVIHTNGPDVLVFVHGFNSSLEGAEAALVQLALIAGWKAKPAVLYSWPSQGRANRYTADSSVVNDAEEVAHLRSFLNDLVSAVPNVRIHLVAHSMGHRLVFDTLLASPKLIHAIVSADYFAPDVLPGALAPVASLLSAGRVPETVFYNKDDLALYFSQCLNGQMRLGGQTPPTVGGVQAFDATPYAMPDGWGHGYFGNTLRVAQEFNEGLNGSASPDPMLAAVPWLSNRSVPLQLTLQERAAKSAVSCAISGQLP